MRIRLAALAAAVASSVACAQAPGVGQRRYAAANETTTGAPKLCTAIRGNGEYIVTHFASLARIVESYGVVDGVAGGSSGSITTFVYDSILRNPAIGAGRSDPTRRRRVALALKSLQGYGETLVESQEGTEIADLASTNATLKSEMDARGIEALISTDTVKAASELTEVLAIPEVKTLVNPEALSMLTDVDNLAFNVNEVYTSAKTLGAFSVDDNRLFFRPGILNWDGLSDLFGRVGDFYAGYSGADTDAQSVWLDHAAVDSTAGKSWQDISPMQCGQDFRAMVATLPRRKFARTQRRRCVSPQHIGDQTSGSRRSSRRACSKATPSTRGIPPKRRMSRLGPERQHPVRPQLRRREDGLLERRRRLGDDLGLRQVPRPQVVEALVAR